jgi:hypothetical protein
MTSSDTKRRTRSRNCVSDAALVLTNYLFRLDALLRVVRLRCEAPNQKAAMSDRSVRRSGPTDPLNMTQRQRVVG